MKITYLLLFPFTKNISSESEIKIEGIKRSPYFLDIDIHVNRVSSNQFEVESTNITEEVFIYDESAYVFEFTYETNIAVSEELSAFKTKINNRLRQKTVSEFKPTEKLVEEFTILQITDVAEVSEFVQQNRFTLARFIRSQEKKISKSDADEILFSEVSYSNDDVSFVDWEGAVLIDKEGDFDSQIELLKVGNYQLMRYRILDQAIELNLTQIRDYVENKKKLVGKDFIRNAIKNRLSILLDFDKVDQSLLLIGDWYSSKLYTIIMREFYIEDWRNLVRNKIENLETMDTALRDNLAFSWSRIFDIVQTVGWLFLLIGYLLLYFIDAGLI